MIGQNHESESLGILRWLTLAIAIALGILLMCFVPVMPPPGSSPPTIDPLTPRTIAIR